MKDKSILLVPVVAIICVALIFLYAIFYPLPDCKPGYARAGAYNSRCFAVQPD